jgi:hypothetical protein
MTITQPAFPTERLSIGNLLCPSFACRSLYRYTAASLKCLLEYSLRTPDVDNEQSAILVR